MPTEIVVETEDRPGVIAEIGELFGQARVNIKAAAAFSQNGSGHLHFVVDNADRALAALKVGGWKVTAKREVLSVSLGDEAGELGRYARRLAEAGVNITVGLPFVRTSVDHGTAFDIAGTGKADERSMIEALRQAVALAPKETRATA